MATRERIRVDAPPERAPRERIRVADPSLRAYHSGSARRASRPARGGITLMDAIADPHLFAPWFRDPATWASWFTFIAALFALDMTSEQLSLYRQLTGRTAPPDQVAREAWLVCGRRAGKSFILALVAVFLACFHDYRKHLAPGERGMVIVVAADRKQARVILRYIRALLTHVPMLKSLIERETNETIDLTNSITIEVGTASFKSVRGYTIVAALCDEIAFWQTEESSNPDAEILAAIRPGLATIPNALLLCASSPYSRKGVLWTTWQRHYGKDHDPILVMQAPTSVMNPTVPQHVIDDAYERDPASAAAEFGANFRTDIESFIAREAVDACVSVGVHERAPMSRIKYHAFVDPSGGSKDSFTLAIGHMDKGVAVLDAIRERKPPFSPEDVVTEFAALLKTYRISKVVGDRYAGEWPRERFKVHGISYDPAAKPKSDIYRDCLPLLNSRKVDLLDHAKLATQIIGLERRTARFSGKDSIDHAPGGHDDVANCVAGVLTLMGTNKYRYDSSLSWIGDGLQAETDAWKQGRLQHFIQSGGMIIR